MLDYFNDSPNVFLLALYYLDFISERCIWSSLKFNPNVIWKFEENASNIQFYYYFTLIVVKFVTFVHEVSEKK